MIKLHFNIVSFFGGGGEEGEVFVTACQYFKQLYLKTSFSLFTDPLFSLQRRWSRCTYENKKNLEEFIDHLHKAVGLGKVMLALALCTPSHELACMPNLWNKRKKKRKHLWSG